MSERGNYYEGSPKIQRLIRKHGDELAVMLERWMQELEREGADSNDRLSALSHWTAQAIHMASRRLAQRYTEFGGTAQPREALFTLVRVFINDATARALAQMPEAHDERMQ